jgi:hypothetical protein
MDCSKVEQRLSEYMESSLPADEMSQVARHLESCRQCSALLNEMRFAVSVCQSYPELEMDLDLLEKVLFRTSGRPRTRSFRERLDQYFIRPLLTPRFAAGVSLATLFLVLMFNLMMPRLSEVVSVLSPPEMLRLMDRGVQRLYGEGLKAYDKTSEWQAQFDFFKDNTLNKLRFIFEQMEVPVEGRKKSEEPAHDREKAPGEKSSRLWPWRA